MMHVLFEMVLVTLFLPFLTAGSILLPTVAPAASTLSKQEQDRLAMPPPPAPQLSASPSDEEMADGDSVNKQSLTTPLASTIGSGKFN